MTKNKRIVLTFFAVGLVLFIAVPLLAQNAKVYFSQGGNTLTVGNGGTLVFAAGSTLTGAGLPSAALTAGMTVTGAAVNLNASSNFAVNIGTGTSTGTITLGGGTTTQAIALVSGTGDITATSTDDISFTATDDFALNGGSAGSILTLGGNTHGNVINIAADDTTADTITIGSAKDTSALAGIAVTVGSTGTTSALTLQSGTGDITMTSADDMTVTITGSAAISGQDLTLGLGTGTSNVVIQSGTGDISMTSSDDIIMTAATNGTVGTGVAAAASIGATVTDTLTFTLTGANDIDVADGGKSKGTLIYTFPEGRILLLGAVVNASIVTNNVYNASANDIYYVSVGSVDGTQAADADLTSTEADIIPKTELDTVSSTTLTLDFHAAMGTLAYANNVFDGTTTAETIFLNVAVPDASNTGATTHAVTGTLKLTYINLGDY